MEERKLTITAIILTKNEAERIGDCLNSLAFVDQLIVIDNGSTDATIGIAKKYGAEIYFSKIKNFSKLRNLGLAKSTGDWVLYLDADERVTPKLQTEIATLTKSFDAQSQSHSYSIKRKNYYLGSEWPYQDQLERLFWKKSLRGWYGKLHETARVQGPIGLLHESMLHYTHRNLEEMVAKTNEWSEIEAKLRCESHHPQIVWWRLLRVMLTGFWGSFVKQDGWKAGTIGWIESIYQAFSMFVTYAKLWELQERDKKTLGDKI